MNSFYLVNLCFKDLGVKKLKKKILILFFIFFIFIQTFAQDFEGVEEKIELEPPTNLTATPINDQSILLKWEDNCNIETGYKIERKGGGRGYTEIASLDENSTSYIDKELSYHVKYTYKIFCYKLDEKSDYSNKVTVTTIFSQPSELSAELINDQSVKLTWKDNCDFEEGFIVERKDKRGDFTEITRTPADETSFTDKGLTIEVKYLYRVRAYTSLNLSDFSNKITVETVFPPPSNFKVRAIDDQTVRLSWEDKYDFEEGFRIEGKEEKGDYTEIAEISENIVYYTDKGLTDNKTYVFRIKAFSEINESDYSKEISISTDFPPPQNLYIDVINDQSIKLYWEDKSTFVEGYWLERKKEDEEFEIIAELSSTVKTYIHEGLILGREYTYRLKAWSELNESDYSSEVGTKTDFPGPANLYSEKIDDQSIKLYWEDNCAFEDGYKLERKEKSGKYEVIAELAPNTTFYRDSRLSYGKVYHYRVVAFTSTSFSAYSNEHEAKTFFPKPTYLSALVLDDQSIKLSWVDNCNFDEGFKLERKDNENEFQVIATLDRETISYLDEGLCFRTNYVYRVCAITSLNSSDYSNKVSTETLFPEPTFLSSEVLDDQSISIYWEYNCDFETGFRLERKAGDNEFIQLAEFGDNTTSYIDKGLNFGTIYYYRVLAFTTFNESDYSNVEYAATIFPKPTNLKAEITGASEIEITWSDNCYFEDGYSIERSDNGSDFMEIGKTSSNITSFKDSGLAYGANYTYRVSAFTNLNNSDYSKTITKSLGMGAPANVTASVVGDRQIRISWTDITRIEEGFKIERHPGDNKYKLYSTVPANVTSFIDKNTEIHVKYYYRVYSYTRNNQSSYSNEVHATCHFGELRVPEDYTTIQFAIDAAIDGNTVIVQPGTYQENLDFDGKNIIVGSLFLTSGNSSYISQTILDGNKEASVVTFENDEDKNALLIGFTVTNGIGNAFRGGGIFIYDASPTLKNLFIIGNSADEFGGGIYLYNSNPVLENLTISGNFSTGELYGYGGGMYLSNSNPQMIKLQIIENSANEFGGGIYVYNSNPELKNCIIASNKVTGNNYGYGGGIYTQYSHLMLENLTIFGNSSLEGGAIFCNSFSNPKLYNSILWNNTPQEICFHKFGDIKITIGYTNFEGAEKGIKTNNNGSIFFQVGFINVDPMFNNPEFNNFRLQAGSPCIDAGNPAEEYNDVDGSRNDLGAYGGVNGDW